MPRYNPTAIAYKESGLVADRQKYVIPEDAYTELENAYVWRGVTKRRLGNTLLGRLRRALVAETDDVTGSAMSYTPPGTGSQTIAIFTVYGVNSLEPDASLQPGSASSNLVVTLDPGGGNETILTDATGDGTMVVTGGGPIISGTPSINYATGVISATFTSAPGALTVSLSLGYYPGLPVMGVRGKELDGLNQENTLFFDTRYCYQFSATQFSEYLPGTNWLGGNSNFFWSTNYGEIKRKQAFWATNFFPNIGGHGRPHTLHRRH